eukprot:CAMPEP_0202695196 /NCGR_PEP_ID=MMETSP1385-20130828/8849_1 /ASSEMBLY_ACC=CAM_ASM_000861 /TAXON_ID=933848 /ORGANISM="Elphidium margaritaceum" /LENGTH=137 /DNA_ID=CAMNT_0049351175 /DNA_START=28 /DNA_END=437 /DNA_ORIENTATION=+
MGAKSSKNTKASSSTAAASVATQQAQADDEKTVPIHGSNSKQAMATDDEKTSSSVQRMTVYVVQARNLPKYDVGPTAASDPYVTLKFGSKGNAAYKTSTIRRDLNPVWNESFQLEGGGIFADCDCITFEVFDWDRVS